MTAAKLRDLWQTLLAEGDEDAAVMAIYKAGWRAARGGNVPAPGLTRHQQRRAHKAAAVPFLKKRHARLLELVAVYHGVPVGRLFAPHAYRRLPEPHFDDACYALREVASLDMESIGAMAGCSHSAVFEAVMRVSADADRVAELRAAVGARGAMERRRVAA